MADPETEPQTNPEPVITVGGETAPIPSPVPTPNPNPAPNQNPNPDPSPFAQTAAAADPFAAVNNPVAAAEAEPGVISWTASEFIAHEKDAKWYVWLVVCAVALAALIFLITRDMVSTSVVIVAAALLGFYGSRQPRQVEYRLDTTGISIGKRHYPFQDFRSFAVMPEGAFSSIEFMPLKRFAPPVSLYYAPEDEDAIVALLADQLPFEHRQPDAIDKFMRQIRF